MISYSLAMSSQIITPHNSQLSMEEESNIPMINDPEILNDIPSPDNIMEDTPNDLTTSQQLQCFEYPPFVDTMQIDGIAKKIRKMYRTVRREQNLCKNINNYDKYKERCIKCKLNPRPIELLIAEQENLREKLLNISKDIDYIKF